LNHALALVTLSLMDEPWMARTPWEKLCGDAGLVDSSGRRVTGKAFQDVVSQLLEVHAIVASGNQYRPSPLFIAPATEIAVRAGVLGAIATRLPSNRWAFQPHAVRHLRVAIALADAPTLALRLGASCPLNSPTAVAQTRVYLFEALTLHAPSAWIAQLPRAHRDVYLSVAAESCILLGRAPDPPLREHLLASERDDVLALLVILLTFVGDQAVADSVLGRLTEPGPWSRSARAFLSFVRGDHASARAELDLLRRKTTTQRVLAPSVFGVFHALLAVTDDRPRDMGELLGMIERAKRDLPGGHIVLPALMSMVDFRRRGESDYMPMYFGGSPTWLGEVVRRLANEFVSGPDVEDERATAKEQKAPFAARVRSTGMPWLADRLAEIDARVTAPGSWLALVRRREPWEFVLDALDVLATKAHASAEEQEKGKGRLRWRLAKQIGGVGVDALYLAPGKKSERVISVSRVLSDPAVPCTPQDRILAQSLVVVSDFGPTRMPSSMLAGFVGHPNVVDQDGEPLRVVLGEPELSVVEDGGRLRLSLLPGGFEGDGAAVIKGDGVWTLVKIDAEHERLLHAFGKKDVHVPVSARERVNRTLASLARTMTVRLSGAAAAPERPGDARPRVQLFRMGAGLRARLRVKPFGDEGGSFRPGVPPATVLFTSGEAMVNGVRDLPAEQAAVDALCALVPTLTLLDVDGDDRVARDLQTCLLLLMELRDADALVEWPEGMPMRAPVARSASDIKITVGGGAAWLDVHGSLAIDEKRVLDMRTLLANASRAVGRFVPVGDGDFVALTEDIARKLEALGRAQALGGKEGISSALLPAVGEWSEGFSVEWGKEIEARRAAIARAMAARPKPPRALAAELRDYQREGFTFLARRADAGLGAILADDMGLGKTIQALALLVHRAAGGPALVVAPTSVVRNWELEATRFAPTLRVHRVSELDRAAVVERAGPRDVLLCSYGILVSEQELLSSRPFHTVIYDEAHALKNAGTKRHSAARTLQATAALALTGTPVENHPGELHAVVDVVLPAMLGSRGAFDRAFGSEVPEEQKRARATLRSLVRPLVLRRTKSEVLTELPPKTEIVRVLPPSKEHLAFYEAVRRRAMERARAPRGGKGKPGASRVEILAEIMRLRRAAIDPRLVGGDDAPPGNKLDELVRVATDLREEGHRLLVFSQFLEVLDRAQRQLGDAGLTCRRLDGSMSTKARAAEVAAFEAGEGDVFLLSLKAGGVGLNLTGADYVVHMDPWWNPAVEDQATDRAHRIGQTRPVTVLKLLMEGTIEEKVLALHASKRELYTDLVGDADGKGVLDPALLMELLGGSP
jgi:superfamily II DNA or RNA helicase